jgi:hypothetical protein
MKKFKIPVHQSKWENEFPLIADTNDLWPRIYKDTHTNVNESNIK